MQAMDCKNAMKLNATQGNLPSLKPSPPIQSSSFVSSHPHHNDHNQYCHHQYWHLQYLLHQYWLHQYCHHQYWHHQYLLHQYWHHHIPPISSPVNTHLILMVLINIGIRNIGIVDIGIILKTLGDFSSSKNMM